MTKVYLDDHDIVRLEGTAVYLRDKLLIRLLFHIGCRVSEALAVQVEDIDFVSGTVTIEHLKARIKLTCPKCGVRLGKNHSFCPGCGTKVEETIARDQEHRRMRTLPIDSATLKMLQEFIKRGGPVLRDGKRMIFGINRHRAWQIVKECAEKAGLPMLTNPETGRRHH